jgi:uncharacterized protein YbjT (DUF2867 family)
VSRRPPSGVAVIGAAGRTGRHVLAALARRGCAPTAVIHRDAQAGIARDHGAAAIAIADLVDTATLVAALDGASAVHVVPPLFHPEEAALVRNAVRAAEAVGAERLTYHSVLHPDTPGLPHHQRKSAAEAAIRASSLRWSILRPGMYAQTVLLYVREDTDVVGVPYSLDAPFTVIDVADVAEASATVLLDDGHAYATYELAGPELLTMGELIAQAAEVLGRPLTGEVISPWDSHVSIDWTRSGWADVCAMWSHYDGHGLVGNPAAARLVLGREPTSFAVATQRAASYPPSS